jgi:hypothetical protein
MVKVKFLIFVLLLLPLAMATTTVDVSHSDGLIKIDGTCSVANAKVLLEGYRAGNSMWFTEVTSTFDMKFSAEFVPPKNGEYKVLASCAGDPAVLDSATVGTPLGDQGDTGDTGGTPGGTSGNGGGGGTSCSVNWQCGSWSYCNNQKQQTRTCVDLNHCNSKYKQPNVTQSCAACEESWTCNDVRYCDGGETYCAGFSDEHFCGTFFQQPKVVSSCPSGGTGYKAPPAYRPPVPSIPPQVQIPALSFWEENKIWIIAIPSLIFLILIIILLWLHYRKPHIVYNLHELEDWIQKEQAAGTPDSDIRHILKEQTGWEDKDIEEAFGSFGKDKPVTKGKVVATVKK